MAILTYSYFHIYLSYFLVTTTNERPKSCRQISITAHRSTTTSSIEIRSAQKRNPSCTGAWRKIISENRTNICWKKLWAEISRAITTSKVQKFTIKEFIFRKSRVCLFFFVSLKKISNKNLHCIVGCCVEKNMLLIYNFFFRRARSASMSVDQFRCVSVLGRGHFGKVSRTSMNILLYSCV